MAREGKREDYGDSTPQKPRKSRWLDGASQWNMTGKAPNSKHQAAIKFQIPSTKCDYGYSGLLDLGFGAFLEFEIWDLVLSCVL